MDIDIVHAIKALLMPPASLLILFFVAAVLQYFRSKLAKPLFIITFCIFFLVSLPLTSTLLTNSLEIYPPLTPQQISESDRDVIIVLGSGKTQGQEYGREHTVTALSLTRLRYAAKLHKQTGLPIIVTGGTVDEGETLEADVMADVLENEFGVTTIYKEGQSRNTAQNAEFSARLMKAQGLKKAFIVTNAWHMRRAMLAFTNYGVDSLAAPTAFVGGELEWSFGLFMPDAGAFRRSTFALHELLGYGWYLLRY